MPTAAHGDLATTTELTDSIFGHCRVQQRAWVSPNQVHHCHTHRLDILILVLTSMSPSSDHGVDVAALNLVIRPTRYAPSQSSHVTSCSHASCTFPLNQPISSLVHRSVARPVRTTSQVRLRPEPEKPDLERASLSTAQKRIFKIKNIILIIVWDKE